MRWLSIFLGMQTGQRLPSNNIVLNYDLHEQALYIDSTTVTFFYNGNLQMVDKLKDKCLSKVLGHHIFGTVLPSFGVWRAKSSTGISFGDCQGRSI